jgi:integrase
MLTTVEINALKPREKAYKVADGKGLYLLVQPSGSLLWRVKFRFYGVEKRMALGQYPDVSLKEARNKRDEARELLAEGVDPVAARVKAKFEAEIAARTTFRLVADEYIEKMASEQKSPATLKKARWFRDLLDPTIGQRPIADVTAHELLRPGELRTAEWSEIDFGAAVWRIPGEKMKMGKPHIIAVRIGMSG